MSFPANAGNRDFYPGLQSELKGDGTTTTNPENAFIVMRIVKFTSKNTLTYFPFSWILHF